MGNSGRVRESSHEISTVRLWDSRDGHDRESMIVRGWRKSDAMSHPFQLGVAKTIQLSEKAVTSAMGRKQTK
jgi:hypothetical protein